MRSHLTNKCGHLTQTNQLATTRTVGPSRWGDRLPPDRLALLPEQDQALSRVQIPRAKGQRSAAQAAEVRLAVQVCQSGQNGRNVNVTNPNFRTWTHRTGQSARMAMVNQLTHQPAPIRRYAWFELLRTGLFVTVRYSQHGTGSGWTAGGLMSSSGSSPVPPGQAHPVRRLAPPRWLSGPAWEQHKSNTSPAIYEDQHAGNTDKTAFTGTRRHDR